MSCGVRGPEEAGVQHTCSGPRLRAPRERACPLWTDFLHLLPGSMGLVKFQSPAGALQLGRFAYFIFLTPRAHDPCSANEIYP